MPRTPTKTENHVIFIDRFDEFNVLSALSFPAAPDVINVLSHKHVRKP